MNGKKQPPATESFFIEVPAFFSEIPRNLREEAKRFIERNAIQVHENSKVRCCCPQCLKAHLLLKSKGNGVDKIKGLPCEVGHVGYYLDREKVVEI